MPNHVITYGVPRIVYKGYSEYHSTGSTGGSTRQSPIHPWTQYHTIWDFDNCVPVNSEYYVSITHLSNSLSLLSKMDRRTTETKSYLNCFGPDEVDDFAAAIIRDDMLALESILYKLDTHVQDATIVIKDKSWEMNNRDSDSKCIAPIKNDWSLKITPLWLALLCQQPEMVRKLLPGYSNQMLYMPVINDFNFFAAAFNVCPELLPDLFARDHSAANSALLLVVRSEGGLISKDLIKLLQSQTCTLSEQEVAAILLDYGVMLAEQDLKNRLIGDFFLWLLHPGLDFNKVINDNGETLPFLLCKYGQFNWCLQRLLENKIAMDLSIRNSEGKVCFDLANENVIIFSPLLSYILEAPTLKSKVAFLQQARSSNSFILVLDRLRERYPRLFIDFALENEKVLLIAMLINPDPKLYDYPGLISEKEGATALAALETYINKHGLQEWMQEKHSNLLNELRADIAQKAVIMDAHKSAKGGLESRDASASSSTPATVTSEFERFRRATTSWFSSCTGIQETVVSPSEQPLMGERDRKTPGL